MKRKYRIVLKTAGWIYFVLLLVIYWSLLFVYFISSDCGYIMGSILHCLRHLWAIISSLLLLVAILIIKIWRRKRWKPFACIASLSARYHLIPVIFILLTIHLLSLVIDIPNPDPIYSRKDIPIPPEDVQESYDHLMQFRRGGGIEVPRKIRDLGLDYEKVIADPAAHTDIIEKAWEELADTREIFLGLNRFNHIAGITPTTEISFNTDIIGYMKLRTIVRSLSAYAILLTERGDSEEAVRCCLDVHSVVKKAVPHSVTATEKMIWAAIDEIAMKTIYRIMKHPRCSSRAVAILANDFGTLSVDDISLRTPLMCEYIATYDAINKTESERLYSDFYGNIGFKIYSIPSAISFPFLYNRNRTKKLINDKYNAYIRRVAQNPENIKLDRNGAEAGQIQGLHNLLGQGLVQVLGGIDPYLADLLPLKVNGDLLLMEVNKRMGRELILTDILSGKPYFVDASSGKYASVGLDHSAGTKDDIISGEFKCF